MNKANEVLVLGDVQHDYVQGDRRIEVLKGASLSLKAGEVVGLLGPSGAGKSTLLHLAGLLEGVQKGRVAVDGTDMGKGSDAARTTLRRSHIGFVYQFHNLLPEFTALENIMMPVRIAGGGRIQAEGAATEMLTQLGLAARADHFPSELSGGEQQRVAIARALVNEPKLVLADEPTGALDPATGGRVFEVFIDTLKARGAAAVIATHNHALAAGLDRCLILEDGRLKPHKF
ncbi:MAG: ABC transporter ATP-binding protein [Parvibaculales bacterium]